MNDTHEKEKKYKVKEVKKESITNTCMRTKIVPYPHKKGNKN